MKKELHQLLKYSRKKITIIEYFLTHRNNSSKEIAQEMGVSEWFVSNTISEWAENDRTITVASKL
jgi:DNA-binding transcriptional regulator LsrR (DeoR family)